jgi:hypothetical protein
MWCEVRDPQAEPSRRDEIGLTVLSLDVGGVRYILLCKARDYAEFDHEPRAE